VAATLTAFQVVLASSASDVVFTLSQLPLALECLDPVLKLLPQHLQALWLPKLLHAVSLHFPWREKPPLASLSCLAADPAAFQHIAAECTRTQQEIDNLTPGAKLPPSGPAKDTLFNPI
jgi:hypothetical protein